MRQTENLFVIILFWVKWRLNENENLFEIIKRTVTLENCSITDGFVSVENNIKIDLL